MSYSLKDIINIYKETFYTQDDSAIALVAAILIGSKLETPPVWLYLVGPSSGGKSELVNAFSKVPFVTQVSDLTPNTFLSGMANSHSETSLLKRLGKKFVITMKDFTTILSKSDESQQAIISQMREVYDGHIVKYTGTGVKLEWGPKGKATFIMASTESIYTVQEKFADMGTRAINYVLLPQDRIKTTLQSLKNNNDLEKKQAHIQEVFAEFVLEKMKSIPDQLPELSDELQLQIVEIANFSSMGRSVVKRDYKGSKSLALSAEMPMRMAKQLLSVAQLFTFINDGVLSDDLKKAVFKIGLDSIPKQRRLVLEVLAKYYRITNSGISDQINYPPDRCKEWIEDLNMFHVCDRIKTKSKNYWKIREEYRQVMVKYMGIKPVGQDLEGEDEAGDSGYAATGNYADPDISYERAEENEISKASAEMEFNKIT